MYDQVSKYVTWLAPLPFVIELYLFQNCWQQCLNLGSLRKTGNESPMNDIYNNS